MDAPVGLATSGKWNQMNHRKYTYPTGWLLYLIFFSPFFPIHNSGALHWQQGWTISNPNEENEMLSGTLP